jgi:hypothetical protein
MSARRGTSSWCIAAGVLRIFSALSSAPMDIADMDAATEPQSPPPAPDKMIWVQERRSDLELTKRLHKSTKDLDLSRVFVGGFVELIQDTAAQSCCSPLYVGFTVIPIIGAAAGPDVSACAWHEGSAGYKLKLASTIMIAGASGTGKSNAARVHLTASAMFEEKTGTRVVSTDFTNASLKTRMFECRQALVILEEARGHACRATLPHQHPLAERPRPLAHSPRLRPPPGLKGHTALHPPAAQGSKLRDGMGMHTGAAAAERAEMLVIMDQSSMVTDRKKGRGGGGKGSPQKAPLPQEESQATSLSDDEQAESAEEVRLPARLAPASC